MKAQIAIWLLAATVGAGFAYSAFGFTSVVFGVAVAYRLWWLEVLVLVLVAWLVLQLAQRLATRQHAPRQDQSERAVWRLAYRKGGVVTLEEVCANTMLGHEEALKTLRILVSKGEATECDNGRWELQA